MDQHVVGREVVEVGRRAELVAIARSLDTPTPLLDAAVPFYRAAVEAGLGDLDAAALRQLLRDLV
ncbi:MAG: hypothetical protein F4015_00795 [Acidimicrobiia bacterium]|nr:hypothetical protein [Acidimicrobiia bacterium]